MFDPNRFCDEQLRVKLDPWQREANEAIADYVRWCYGQPVHVQLNGAIKNSFTVKAMHGPGKTFWLGTLICWFGSVFPDSRIPCVAPKLEQLKTRLWLEIKKIRAGATSDFQKMTEDIGSIHMRWCGSDTWTAFGQTATHAENLAGLHNDFLLVCVDEATGVREDLFPVIEGALSTGKVVIFVMISNPSKKTGTFAMSWLNPRVSKDYYQVKIDLDKAPRVDRKWVQKMVDKYGAQSPIVKIRCYGEFADDSPQQLISTQWIMDAMAREWATETNRNRLRVSADVSDGGEDESVITVAEEHEYGRTLLKCSRHSWPSSVAVIECANMMEQRFAAFGGRKGIDEMVVDGLGVGAGTAGTLIKRGHRVVVHKGGEASSDKLKWRNRRVQNYCACRDAYRDGRVSVAADCFEQEDQEEMLAQMASIELNPSTDRVDDLITKEQMKDRGLKSPDIADSIAMLWTVAQGAGQGVIDFTRAAAERAAEQKQSATPAAIAVSASPPVVTTTHGSLDESYKR